MSSYTNDETEMSYKVNDIITIRSGDNETTVKVVDVRAKAIKVAGNASQAWYPKSGIDADGNIANWVQGSLSHSFLWECPWDESKRVAL